MKNAKGFAAIAFISLSPTLARAEPWSGDFGLGYLATTGNATTSSLNGKFHLIYAQERWKNSLSGSAVSTYADHESSAENYLATEQLDLNLTPRDYLFGVVEWNKDLFAAIRERTSETVGYGRHVLIGPRHFLDLELGAGARQQQTNEHPRERDDELIERGAAKYQFVITPTTTFGETLKVETGSSNTYSESVSALKLQIVGNVYANLSYTIKNNTQSAPDTKKTDTEAAVSVSYEFGKARS